MPGRAMFMILMSALVLVTPGTMHGQDARSDVQVWSQSCSNCHRNQPARRYTADQWSSIMAHMKLMARLTDGEADAVLRYLGRGARGSDPSGAGAAAEITEPDGPFAVQDAAVSGPPDLPAGRAHGPFGAAGASGSRQTAPDGKALFEKECASCHGQQGRGNGRAGRDMDPRPTDISDPQFLSERTDEQLLQVVANGKGEMVGIGGDYDEDAMKAIIAYVRTLGEQRKR